MNSVPMLACALILSGCAGARVADCGPDWHAVGQRDGRLAAGSQVETYRARCAGQVDAARYAEGYSAGLRERPIPGW